MEKYAVNIEVEYDNGIRSCRGFICGDKTVTAGHIFDDIDLSTVICRVSNMNFPSYQATVILVDRHNDVAILTSPQRSDIALGYKRKVGSLIFVADENKTSCRLTGVVNIDSKDKPTPLTELDAYLPKGTSGAPIYDDKGIVLGIIVARDKDRQKTYAVGSKSISQAISKADKRIKGIKVD